MKAAALFYGMHIFLNIFNVHLKSLYRFEPRRRKKETRETDNTHVMCSVGLIHGCFLKQRFVVPTLELCVEFRFMKHSEKVKSVCGTFRFVSDPAVSLGAH